MNPVAYLYVRRPSGTVDYFLADRLELADGFVTVTGRFKRRSGRLEPRRSYVWPRGRIIEIRYADEQVAA